MKTTPQAGRLKAHQSVAWAALAKHADRERERSTLPVGAHLVNLEVSGKAGGRPFSSTIAGTLHVAGDGVRELTEAAEPERIVAWLLCELCRDDAHRAAIMTKLPEVWREQFAQLSVSQVEQAKEMLTRLRARTGTAEKKGDVKFTPQ